MDASLSIDVVRPGDLGAEERAAWRAFRAARPELASPYFDLRYILAAGEIAPHAAVAVVRRAGGPDPGRSAVPRPGCQRRELHAGRHAQRLDAAFRTQG